MSTAGTVAAVGARRSIFTLSLALMVLLTGISALCVGGWVVKTANGSWTWCEDYVFASAKYAVACEPSRECEVGMGVFAFGRPRGETLRFQGEREIWVLGFGALYLRAVDGKGPVKVGFLQKDRSLISTPKIAW